ncbi:MAG TPA: Asp-tRNA(Asn)/Glu-tRNA(Gln) amidotransferase GatCAB subunit A [Firmicutes bacterium]|jgi:aspartyl-tRNA(Asn)/glutamyl-tRNA(Gln) amidotransferase subunit A|nr:Asp-tRNA(Asn)/Glu-tRNA(Gln) amidotransferase GatCAB subunit A [Bacillota bacterium]HBG44097.1 Asp-tRNA(Asn)/Glu-tRNA(Gln) amidotransferase GatCAB subunit A [Bacillota bacterium]HCF89049.1 Asp-tRNA(Asn)/Glu-tRNA(Gln) amidotransferase GatCAB subunit A [Bacillota bacterium]
MRPNEMSARQIARVVNRGEMSPTEIVGDFLKKIAETEPEYHAYITVTQEDALRQAAEVADRLVKGGEKLPLAGVPVAVKDNICTKGVQTTCGSKILAGFVPPYDATVVAKLREAGAIIIGKTNMDEFAMGSSTENSGYFTSRNPYDPARVPGGSSGGSAVAVRCGSAAVGLGTETGGSVRQPAAFCGLVGLKPTYGRVSRYGVAAFASSLDQVGTFGRDIADCALLSSVISGYDANDSTALDAPVPLYHELLSGTENGAGTGVGAGTGTVAGAGVDGIRGLRVGVPKEYFQTGVEPEVAAAVRHCLDILSAMGAIVEETTMPHTEYALPVYYVIAPAEASSNLARYDGVRYGWRSGNSPNVMEMYCNTRDEGFGPEVKRRIMIGTYALSSGYYEAYYLRAMKVRRLIRDDFDAAFKRYDVLVTPTTTAPAFKIGELSEDLLAMYRSDICTATANLAGIPALSMPCKFVKAGGGRQYLPVSVQLMANVLREDLLFRVGYALQEELALPGLKQPYTHLQPQGDLYTQLEGRGDRR